jgi:pimeloyl-ACP methyl ester carboxylesterase
VTRRRVGERDIEIEALGEGRPVLFLHGNPIDHRDLLASVDPVFGRRGGYLRLHVDLPGYGASPPDPAVHGSDGMLAVVLELLDDLVGSEPVILVGCSWGGYLARGVLAARPERVAAIALICPVVVADRTRRDLDPFRQLVPPDGPLRGGSEADRADFLAGAVVAGPDQWAYYRAIIAPALAAADPATVDRVEAAYDFAVDVDRDAPPFDGPALVVLGRQDSVVGYRDARGLLDRFRRATVAVVDSAGHNLMSERPAVLAALVDDWLARVELAERPG